MTLLLLIYISIIYDASITDFIASNGRMIDGRDLEGSMVGSD
jgi:hypothetical protein